MSLSLWRRTGRIGFLGMVRWFSDGRNNRTPHRLFHIRTVYFTYAQTDFNIFSSTLLPLGERDFHSIVKLLLPILVPFPIGSLKYNWFKFYTKTSYSLLGNRLYLIWSHPTMVLGDQTTSTKKHTLDVVWLYQNPHRRYFHQDRSPSLSTHPKQVSREGWERGRWVGF